MANWSDYPIQHVALTRIVFPCHDIHVEHIHPDDGVTVTTGPIHLEQLIDGSLFVHDGRHRYHRAAARGDTHITARIHT
jgi:hypothetical protein